MIDPAELAHRFAYHPPKDSDTARAHETVRSEAGDLAALANELLPDGREKATAFTKLEEFMMWANAAIARAGAKPGGDGSTSDGR